MTDPWAQLPVDVRRSARRRRTVSARVEAGRLVVLIPDVFTTQQESEWVATMRIRLAARQRRGPSSSDEALRARAHALSARYLGGRAVPASVRWVDNQHTRWGSATPSRGSIRLSRTLVGMPDYVIDYVLLHELAHLLEADHGPAFWALLREVPFVERARGYLDGYTAGRSIAQDPTRHHCAADEE
ncbi:M48 metallopeptidase family protein [Austwickia chelonae]|uniref:M48 metallopeptidase family protein n=1 Tax=Austwickia chelonae TaxID=100225 RepID=UPI000E222325|nr:M48 family metallopeptidase [Austwickia chelonae]